MPSNGPPDNWERVRRGGGRSLLIAGFIPAAVIVLIVALPLWVWFFWRIELGPGEIAVLIRKTGRDLPPGQVIATEPDQKGIQLDVLPEGRHFRNPYTWAWEIRKITDIPAGKLGVLIRRFGDDLPPGRIMAGEGQKGVLADVLRPGKYRINPYAYEVKQFDAVTIRPGHVGVVVSLVGKDVLYDEVPEDLRNGFLVRKGYKGVLPEVLEPGTYYLNPYTITVVEVNLQSQRFEMSGEDAISFFTADGFTVRVEGTIEFNIVREEAARLLHRVGNIDAVIQKIILPRARGFSRIEGSKKPAVDFITGETRQQFEDSLEQHLQRTCEPWGISINSVLIRNIIPPDEISQVIREREIAVQEAKKYERQIEQARSRAELVRQEMLAEQNKKKVEAETEKLRAEIQARQEAQVKILGAEQELEVAKVQKEAAAAKIAAKMAGAKADQDVIRAKNEAESEVLKQQADAFGGGEFYARYLLLTRLAPAVTSILTNDAPDSLGGFLLPLLREAGSGDRPSVKGRAKP